MTASGHGCGSGRHGSAADFSVGDSSPEVQDSKTKNKKGLGFRMYFALFLVEGLFESALPCSLGSCSARPRVRVWAL